MDLTTPSDDLDARSRPIVAIYYNRFLVVLCAVIGIAPVLALVASLAAHRLWPDRFDLNWAPGPAGWVQVAWPVLVLMILVPFAIWAGLAHGFAVFREGIKVQVKRIPPGRSRWDPWQYGCYSRGRGEPLPMVAVSAGRLIRPPRGRRTTEGGPVVHRVR
jgi:hypothetical protein